jgi:sulfur relay (sulfurtransferase) DsrF/TusC family protein
MKALNIIETGYRATLEEQDDPGVWLSYTLKVAGGDVDVLLRGNAVNYAVKGQDSTGLQYGAWQQTQPPRLADNIASLTSKRIVVFIVSEDLQERGLEGVPLVEGLTPVTRSGLARLFDHYEQVWHW